VSSSDTIETLEKKVRLASILGTIQSTLTNFKYISKKWKENCEEERLLGVSLTGIMDSKITNGTNNLEAVLTRLKNVAVDTNKEWASKLGINQAAAVTCVKPSGTVSLLVDSSSGIHTRYSPYYIRTVRSDKKDPLAQMMVDFGFPVEDEIKNPETNYVFSFPVKSPESAVFRKDVSAIEQLEIWLSYHRFYCEHKPSVTVYVKEDEWMAVGAWVYEHFDELSGVSFLPFSDHIYKQAPIQECSEEEYRAFLTTMPECVDWSVLANYEKEDSTTGSQQYACSGGSCELV
jgi:ribonucleoside-diphosphate reductase alpha chain